MSVITESCYFRRPLYLQKMFMSFHSRIPIIDLSHCSDIIYKTKAHETMSFGFDDDPMRLERIIVMSLEIVHGV